MLDRLLSIVVSVLLAFLVWLYARSRDQDTLDNVPIPVKITLAPGQAEHYDLEVLGPTPVPQIPVSFTGPPSRIREVRARLQNGDLRAAVTLTIPESHLEDSKYSESVGVFARHIHAPPGVKPTVVEGQNRIPVNLYRVVERRLKVRPEYTGEARLTNVSVDPPVIVVRGPREVLDKLTAFPIQGFTVPEAEEPAAEPRTITTKPISLPDKLEGRPVVTSPATVTARFTVQPRQKLYQLDDLPVQFLCPPDFPLRPLFDGERAGKMTLRLAGPPSEEPPVVVAYVDLSGRRWEPGLYDEPVKLHIPKDYRLLDEAPGRVSFRLVNSRDAALPER